MNDTAHKIKTLLHKPAFGLLIIRLAVGGILAYAGWNKLQGGEAVLNAVGANIKVIGIDVGTGNAFTFFFGIMAAVSELLGGLLLIVGYLFRTATVPLIATMVVATLYKYGASEGDFTQYGYPLLALCVLIGLLFTGPGRISLQKD